MAVAAIILSGIGIKKRPDKKGMAIAGLITGILGLLLGIVSFILAIVGTVFKATTAGIDPTQIQDMLEDALDSLDY